MPALPAFGKRPKFQTAKYAEYAKNYFEIPPAYFARFAVQFSGCIRRLPSSAGFW
jgi:hypothetical protein